MKKILLMLVFLLVPGVGLGTTYTVCSSGCSETTIQAVFDNNDLAPGDIVEIQADTPGGSKTYSEKVTWGSNDVGDSDNQVALQGRSGDTITIACTGNDYCITQQSVGLDYITIRRLSVTGSSTRNIWLDGSSGVEDNGIVLSDIISSGGAGGIWARNKSNSTFSNLTISGMTGTTGFALSFTGTGVNSNSTIANISITGGGTSTSGALALSKIDGMVISGDITVSNTGADGVGVSIISATGGLSLSSAATISISNTNYIGLFIKDTTATISFDGTVDVDTTAAQCGVSIQNSSFGVGSYIDTLVIDSSAASGIETIASSNLWIKLLEATNNVGSGVLLATSGSNLVIGSNDRKSIIAGNGYDGFSNNDSVSATIKNCIVRNNGGGDGVPVNEGDGVTGHDTSTTYAIGNLIYDNDNTGLAFIGDSTLYAYNNTVVGNGVDGGPRGGVWTDNDTGSIILKNNIISQNIPFEVVAVDATALGTITADYNWYYHPADTVIFTTDNGVTIQSTVADWRTASGQDANSGLSNPNLNTDYSLLPESPSINAGTIPYSDGSGDQYDFNGNKIWNDATDAAESAWADGVEIGAYGYFGGKILMLGM